MPKVLKYKKALVILGPTTTGKTEVAFTIAKRFGGELINGDKFYLFSGFPTSTGLSSFLVTGEVPTHLYQELEPRVDRLSLIDYLLKVNSLVPNILRRNKLPIIEGCSYGYTNAIIEVNKLLPKPKYGPFIGLRWPKGYDLQSKVEERVNSLFREGAISEIERELKESHKYSYPMRKGVITVPIVEMLEGRINENKAKDKIIIGMLDSAYSALRKFLDIKDTIWLKHDSKKFEETISEIMRLVKKENL